MARTATKKKTAKKKAAKKTDPVDDLAGDIESDLEKEFDFDDGDATKGKKAKAAKTKAKGGKSKPDYMGQTVTFTNDDNDEITGKVVEQKGKDLVVEDTEAYWECKIEDLHDTKGKASKAAAPKKGKGGAQTSVESIDEKLEIRVIEIDKIKIPKVKAREFNPDNPEWKRLCADIKKRKQRIPIEVNCFDKSTLTDGLQRLEALKALGKTTVRCMIGEAGDTDDDRLWNSLLANENRLDMHWTELATAWARLIKGGDYTQSKIARAFGISQSDISRMVSALKLPKAIVAVAKTQATGQPATEKGPMYSDGVFYELVAADKSIQKWAQENMAKGAKLTQEDVRQKKRADKKDKAAKGEPTETRGGNRGTGAVSATYARLSSADVGDYLKVTVYEDHVTVQAHIDWKKKTFKGFDPTAEIKELFSCVFADDDTTLDSFAALAKALGDAKKGLS